MCFHYIIANNVAFLTLAERGYPKVMVPNKLGATCLRLLKQTLLARLHALLLLLSHERHLHAASRRICAVFHSTLLRGASGTFLRDILGRQSA